MEIDWIPVVFSKEDFRHLGGLLRYVRGANPLYFWLLGLTRRRMDRWLTRAAYTPFLFARYYVYVSPVGVSRLRAVIAAAMSTWAFLLDPDAMLFRGWPICWDESLGDEPSRGNRSEASGEEKRTADGS